MQLEREFKLDNLSRRTNLLGSIPIRQSNEHQDVSWLDRHPEAREKIVAMIHIEHLGEMDYREVDDRVESVGLPEQSLLWVRNNQTLIGLPM